MSTTKINFTDINIKDFIKYIVKFDNVNDILDTFHSSKKKLVINQVSDIVNKFKLYKTLSKHHASKFLSIVFLTHIFKQLSVYICLVD
jgi:hypothetical protein